VHKRYEIILIWRKKAAVDALLEAGLHPGYHRHGLQAEGSKAEGARKTPAAADAALKDAAAAAPDSLPLDDEDIIRQLDLFDSASEKMVKISAVLAEIVKLVQLLHKHTEVIRL
jgi:hypothetical protein